MTNNGPIVGLEYPATMLRQIISLKRDFDKHGDNTSSTQINHWDDIQITFDTFNMFSPNTNRYFDIVGSTNI